MRPKLPPRKGYIEAIINGERVYRDSHTGETYSPENLPNEKNEFREQFRKTDEYALMEYVFMMEGLK